VTENESLRRRNLLLEEKCTAFETKQLSYSAQRRDISIEEGHVNSLRTKLRNTKKENDTLKSQNEVR